MQKSCDVEAELLVHLGEIDERKLYLDCAFPSMFTFCVGELGFSEGAAYNRIMVARAARRMPVIAEALRTGQVHLAGATGVVVRHRDVGGAVRVVTRSRLSIATRAGAATR